MVVWFLLLDAVLLALCVCNVVIPRRMWGLFRSWRFKNPEVVEPSDLVVWWYRISGALGAILIGALAWYGLTVFRSEDRCEEVLPELVRLHEEDGTSAVERRGRELGLEVQDDRGGGATIVLTEDGKPFATISTISSNAFCNH